MKKIIEIRTAVMADIDGILELEKRVWLEIPASREMVTGRLTIFPEGNFVAVDKSCGTIVGYLCLMFLGFAPSEFPNSWAEITGNGTLSTHNPDGKYMYGVTLTVDKGYSVGMELQIRGWAFGIKHHRVGCYFGSPIPGFAEYMGKNPGTKVEDYVFRTERKKGVPYDHQLAYYSKAGFKAVRVLPNYESDSKSLNYGVLVYTSNIFYYWPFRSFIAWLVKRFGFRLLKMLGV